MLLTALVAVPLTAAAAPYVGPSSTGQTTVWTLPGDTGPAIGIAANGYVATALAVWTGSGYPVRVPVPGNRSYAIADMNNSGTVAGWYLAPVGTDSVLRRGFVWTPGDAQILDVGNPGLELEITGIDDAGRVVGWYTAGPGVCDSSPGRCGFIAEPRDDGTYGTIEQIGPAGGVEDGHRFIPLDIGNGVVVGDSWTWDSTSVDPMERWEPLVGPISGSLGQGVSINEWGQIAGQWIPNQGEPEALYWPSRTSTPISIGTTGDDLVGQAIGIGDNGAVAGWTSTSASADRRAWVWKDDAGMVDLGHIPGGSPTAEAYDAHGDLVVGSTGGRGVIWDLSGAFTIDYPPDIAQIGAVTAATGDLVQIALDISDFEGDPFTVTCSGLPTAATCDDDSLVWQTTSGDAGEYSVTVTARQDDSSFNADTVTFPLTVSDGVVLQPIGDRTVEAGRLLTFTAIASGGTSIRYSFSPSITGATLDAITGVFEWTPTLDQSGSHEVTVVASAIVDRVTVSDSETLTITVTDPGSPPQLSIITETISVTDAVTVTIDAPVVITVEEAIAVADTAGVRPPVRITITETVGVADTAGVRPSVVITITETVGVADTLALRPPVQIAITETVGVVDETVVDRSAPLRISVTEAVGVVDTVTVRPPVEITITDSVGVVDTVLIEIEQAVTVDSILDYVTALDDDDFRLGSGSRRAIERLIAAAGNSLDAVESALKRMDGCGEIADRNDLIVDCDAQHEVRRLLILLREQLLNED